VRPFVLAAALVLAQPTPGPVEAGAPALRVTPLVRQGALWFASSRVAASGMGGGAGAELTWRERWLGQVDAGILWGAGNLGVLRLAAGGQRRGLWAPAGWVTFTTLWGSRIETLDDAGRRPDWPGWAVGLRLSPLRLAGRGGSVSALEVGWGRGAGGGTLLELTVLQGAVSW
jgi:hypothetical protein